MDGIRRISRRDDVKNRRKTLRQSALDAKRGTCAMPEFPERVTRQNARTAAVDAKKLRKAITAREVQKAKPPFNPYIRVKHTGLSPFKSYQDANKRSKVAPWRAPATKSAPRAAAPNLPAPAPVGRPVRAPRPVPVCRVPPPGVAAITKTRPPAPEIPMTAGVVQFPILPHMHHAQMPFRPPAKVQAIPLTTRPLKSVLPVRKEVTKEKVKPALNRPVRGVPITAQPKPAPKVKAQTKPLAPTSSKAREPKVGKPAGKPTVKPTAVPVPTTTEYTGNLKRAKSAAPPKPAAANTVKTKSVSRLGRRTEPPVKRALLPLNNALTNKAHEEENVLDNVQRPSRVLRSSSRLQQKDKENLLPPAPLLELPFVQRRRTKQSTIVAPKDESDSDDHVLPDPAPKILISDQPNAVATTSSSAEPTDERVKGLQERSSTLTKETDRLRCLADEWVAAKSLDEHLTSNAIDEIDAITGQTYLLITKKFIQYKGLIEGAYTNHKTTLDDLDGFWEMIYIQVEQLDNQFLKLADMKKRNWASCSPAPIRKETKKPAKPPKRATAKTNFRKFLAKKKEEITASSESAGSLVGEPSQVGSPSPAPPKTPARDSARLANSPFRRSLRANTPLRGSHPANSSFRGTLPADSPVAQSPRAFENARRASRSIRLSSAMMRASQVIATELDSTISDSLAITLNISDQ